MVNVPFNCFSNGILEAVDDVCLRTQVLGELPLKYLSNA